MNSLTAAWAMRSKRPATVLIIQLPRRSSESQPYTAGTSGHFSIDRNTISSIGALVCSKSNPSADRSRMKREDFTFVHGLRVRWASGELIYVNADLKTRKSAPWPEPIKRAILEFERTRPAEANA